MKPTRSPIKNVRAVLSAVFFMLLSSLPAGAYKPAAGFFLPDSINEMTLKFKTVKGLIVLPVTINDSIQVNLILDTGCRNLILFGRKFKKLFRMNSEKPVRFSGLGTGGPVMGTLAIGNKVSIDAVLGEQIPIVVVGSKLPFNNYHNVHGVIGYDIFLNFEIELDANAGIIVFRPAQESNPPLGYSQVPLRIEDSRPVMKSQVVMIDGMPVDLDLMIDTGSSLELLLKTTNISKFRHFQNEEVLGVGLNGPVSGYQTVSEKIILDGLEIEYVDTGIVSSPRYNNASIGMGILRDYVVIINYCKAYVCFRRNA